MSLLMYTQMIKTRTSRLEELTKYVRENHPYDVCEVISSKVSCEGVVRGGGGGREVELICW